MPVRDHGDTLIGAGLAFTAGFVDAAAFIALTGLFTAHVTGNFVLIGAELMSTSSGVIAKLLALPVFILAVALTRLVTLVLERRGMAPLRPLLALEAAVLIAFAVAGIALSPLGSPDGIAAITVGMLGVAAMGIQKRDRPSRHRSSGGDDRDDRECHAGRDRPDRSLFAARAPLLRPIPA